VIGTGTIDFSGSGVVHVTGGMTALYATYILGPRQGQFFHRFGRKLSKSGLGKGSPIALKGDNGDFLLLYDLTRIFHLVPLESAILTSSLPMPLPVLCKFML
jgi:Ammonium Transporter Family